MRNLSPTNFEKHRLGVGGICVHKEEVLLIQHSFGINKGKWSIPGGYVELGETLSEAVVREVLEETGVKTRVGGLVMLRHSTQKKDENRTISDLYLVFSLDYVKGKAVSDHFETSEAKFISINELKNYNLSDLSKHIAETRMKSIRMYLDEYQPNQEIVSKLNILRYEVFG